MTNNNDVNTNDMRLILKTSINFDENQALQGVPYNLNCLCNIIMI